MKRLFDATCAAAGLVLVAPLLLFVWAVVRLDSPGPALFRQVRVGRGGRPFELLKFRSMHACAEGGSQLTAAGDARVTRVGKVLRRTKLDELPQLWNVLRGEMSLVGPRPEVPRFVAQYPPGDAAIVLSVRPGLTDPLSLQLFDEAAVLSGASDAERAYIEDLLPHKLARQRQYVESATFLSDLQVIVGTIHRVLDVVIRATLALLRRREWF